MYFLTLFKDSPAGHLPIGHSLSSTLWKTFSKDQIGRRGPWNLLCPRFSPQLSVPFTVSNNEDYLRDLGYYAPFSPWYTRSVLWMCSLDSRLEEKRKQDMPFITCISTSHTLYKNIPFNGFWRHLASGTCTAKMTVNVREKLKVRRPRIWEWSKDFMTYKEKISS